MTIARSRFALVLTVALTMMSCPPASGDAPASDIHEIIGKVKDKRSVNGTYYTIIEVFKSKIPDEYKDHPEFFKIKKGDVLYCVRLSGENPDEGDYVEAIASLAHNEQRQYYELDKVRVMSDVEVLREVYLEDEDNYPYILLIVSLLIISFVIALKLNKKRKAGNERTVDLKSRKGQLPSRKSR